MKYEGILGSFVIMTILLALILAALITLPDREVKERVIYVPVEVNEFKLW